MRRVIPIVLVLLAIFGPPMWVLVTWQEPVTLPREGMTTEELLREVIHEGTRWEVRHWWTDSRCDTMGYVLSDEGFGRQKVVWVSLSNGRVTRWQIVNVKQTLWWCFWEWLPEVLPDW